MDYSKRDRIPAELEKVAARLRQERTAASPLELDRIKLQAMRQAKRSRSSVKARQGGAFMRSRLALVLMVTAGFMLSTTGATLAITGASGSGNAAQSQYEQVPSNDSNSGTPDQTAGGVKGESASGAEGESLGGDSTEPASSAAGTEQIAVAGADDSLPFTGFVAIPLLIAGIGLLSAGAILHRKTRAHNEKI